jgi:hypothetical protein
MAVRKSRPTRYLCRDRRSRAVGAKAEGHFRRTNSNFMNENSKGAESQYTHQPQSEPACFRATSLSRMMGCSATRNETMATEDADEA